MRGRASPKPCTAMGHQRDENSSIERPFEYPPIGSDEIRILILLPGNEEDDLWGYFETARLVDRPKYQALSYAWGDPIFDKALHLVDGDLSVTSNLHTALRQLRKPVVALRMWIDAVCINQRDSLERNIQVTMMAHIYRQAEQVVVWLSERSSHDCQNYRTVSILKVLYSMWLDLRSLTVQPIDLNVIRDTWTDKRRQYGTTGCPYCKSSVEWPSEHWNGALSALQSLFSSPWFTRLWIVQEAASGVHVTCVFGDHRISLSTLKIAAEMTQYLIHTWTTLFTRSLERHDGRAFATLAHIHRIRSPIALPSILELAQLSHRVAAGPIGSEVPSHYPGGRLLNDLVRCADLAASTAHDKIYAMRSTSRIEDVESLKPNYSIPLLDLWIRVATHILRFKPQTSILLSLACVGSSAALAGRPPGLPSWTPDFARLNNDESQDRYFTFWQSAAKHDASTAPHRSTQTRISLDAANTLLMHTPAMLLFHIRERVGKTGYSRQQRRVGDLTFMLDHRSFRVSRPGVGSNTSDLPSGTQPSDSVWLLQGCPHPFVTRPLDNCHYRLIGELTCKKDGGEVYAWSDNEEDVVSITLE